MKKGEDFKKEGKRTLSEKKNGKKMSQVKMKKGEIPNLLKNLQFNIKFY